LGGGQSLVEFSEQRVHIFAPVRIEVVDCLDFSQSSTNSCQLGGQFRGRCPRPAPLQAFRSAPQLLGQCAIVFLPRGVEESAHRFIAGALDEA